MIRPSLFFVDHSSTLSRQNLRDTLLSPGNVTLRPFAVTHRLTAGINSAFPPFPSTSSGLIAPGPSHLTEKGKMSHQLRRRHTTFREKHYSLSSFPQFRTRLLGHTMIHLSIVPLPATGDCLRSVHMRAMHWRVLPVRAESGSAT
jgi:hypothetical protein